MKVKLEEDGQSCVFTAMKANVFIVENVYVSAQ